MVAAIPDWIPFLSTTQMFQGLPLAQLEAIGAIAVLQSYKRGEILFWEGDPASGFYVVKTGRIKVFKLSGDGKEQILHLFESGEHFAEVPAFDGQSYPAAAATVETAEVLFFPRQAFLSLLQQEPALAINLLVSFASHMRRLAHLVDSLSLKEVPQRLAAYLLGLPPLQIELADRTPVTAVELDVTKTQLAALLGTIPETLSRVFYRLNRDGLIESDGSTIKLLNPERLRLLSMHKDSG